MMSTKHSTVRVQTQWDRIAALVCRLEEMLNYYLHPITNAASEGLNSRIQALKANARGGV